MTERDGHNPQPDETEFSSGYDSSEPAESSFTNPEATDPVNDEIEFTVGRHVRQVRDFEDLTLAEAFGQLVASPVQTWKMIHNVATQTPTQQIPGYPAPSRPRLHPPAAAAPVSDDVDANHHGEYSPTAAQTDLTTDPEMVYATMHQARAREAFALGLRFIALYLAWVGNSILTTVARTGNDVNVPLGLTYAGIAIAVWLGAEVISEWGQLKAWWQSRGGTDNSEAAEAEEKRKVHIEISNIFDPVRMVLLGVGVAALIVTVFANRDNQFTLLGFITWMLCITTFALALASDDALFRSPVPTLRFSTGIFRRWTFWALVVIVIIGAAIRLDRLDRTPAQMTSDHVEKILDAQRVLDGSTQVFFPNNGGREPFQMYAMALLSQVPGLRMDFFTLKLLSVIEGIITLPFLWWMGREIIGKENPRFGNIVGLSLALLVAVSHWHLALSRLALRIVLTPLIAAVLVVFLGRAMRDNRRDDWLRAGLVLGAGLYMYQAVRMLPLVIIAGTAIAVIALVRSRQALFKYALNFASLVFISFIVFVPMFVFSVQSPDLFWRRTAGRLLGDTVIQETLENGTIISRDPTIGEQLEAFSNNLAILGSNVKNVLFMFNWKGDVAWINNAPNFPQMDTLVGALFILGAAAWVVRMFRKRDVVDWLVPAMLFLMLLPSALAIAYPVENPSATRTSGALPVAYLLAAYPLAIIVRAFFRMTDKRWVVVGMSTAILSLVALGSYAQNADTYFDAYHRNYLLSSLPYEQAGEQLQAFNTSLDGHKGNSFMIAYPFWWDHRALGIAGGMVDYPNGIVSLDDVPEFVVNSYRLQGEYSLDPDRDLLFFHAVEDTDTLEQLREWFPEGESEFIEIRSQLRSYATYRVPALGAERFLTTFVPLLPESDE